MTSHLLEDGQNQTKTKTKAICINKQIAFLTFYFQLVSRTEKEGKQAILRLLILRVNEYLSFNKHFKTAYAKKTAP